MARCQNSRMTTLFIEEFSSELKKQGTPPNQHFAELVKIMKKHKMCYNVKSLNPKLFLTHVKNRGGLLLSPHNAHKNAASIKAAGADIEALTNAWCFELAHDGDIRQETVSKNDRLVKSSGGLLADINGEERFASVGCGHTVAWCKHAQAGGKTPEKSLQVHDSELIDLQRICTDAKLKEMIYEGWEWNVIFAEVDEMFPLLASIAQKALNTRNHIANVVGELEVCVTLANMLKDTGMKDEPGWQQLATDNITSLCAPCAAYANVLLKYIMKYGGGADAPLIHFVDNVAKQFSANVALGQAFWYSLADTQFADHTQHFPMVRTALMLANLTGNKVEDSVARLILHSHVKMVASKSCMADAVTAEKILQDGWAIVQGCSSAEESVKPLGQLFVRIGLKLVGKEKSGREAKGYTWDEIKKMFLRGVGDLKGREIKFPNWFGDIKEDEKPSTKAVTAKSSAPHLADIQDHLDPAFVCSEAGFTVGTMVVMKGTEVTHTSIYAIMAIDADGVKLHQACSFTGTPETTTVKVKTLLKNWVTSKHDLPIIMQDPTTDIPETFKVTAKRAELFNALMEAYNKSNKRYSDLRFIKGMGLDHVRTKDKSFKAGALVLVPAVPMINIIADAKEGSRGIDMGMHGGHKYMISPMAKQANKDEVWAPPDVFVNPFFWVAKVHDKKLANMEESEMSIKDIKVPILKNKIDLPPNTKLDIFVKKVSEKRALMDDDSDNDDAKKVSESAKKGLTGLCRPQGRVQSKKSKK